MIVHTSLIGEVIEEAQQVPRTAQEGGKKVLERLVHSYYWQGMKKDVQLHLATCPTCDKFHNTSERQRAKLNQIPTNDRGDICPLDPFGGKASPSETPCGNRCILTMRDIFSIFGLAYTMPEQSAQTVADALLSRWILLFVDPSRLLTA